MLSYGEMAFGVMEVLSGPGAEAFNYAFTVVTVFALLGIAIKAVIKVVSRN